MDRKTWWDTVQPIDCETSSGDRMLALAQNVHNLLCFFSVCILMTNYEIFSASSLLFLPPGFISMALRLPLRNPFPTAVLNASWDCLFSHTSYISV